MLRVESHASAARGKNTLISFNPALTRMLVPSESIAVVKRSPVTDQTPMAHTFQSKQPH